MREAPLQLVREDDRALFGIVRAVDAEALASQRHRRASELDQRTGLPVEQEERGQASARGTIDGDPAHRVAVGNRVAGRGDDVLSDHGVRQSRDILEMRDPRRLILGLGPEHDAARSPGLVLAVPCGELGEVKVALVGDLGLPG